MTVYDGPQVFEGVADSLERAVEIATLKIPPRQGRDFVVARVVSWGMQFGGFAQQKMFFAQVAEDPEAPFKRTSE
ncbi:hypothetical protein [Bradyrhizobium roseum]|uniref:hypothetical protein n=1 Tax=Bradyrhizobium roseum TaxID=3056648 RepID=UPI0026183445|nr:hypothetical protein [Bradyrhizobium roseus]WKA31328.1 hypothetical protein QUH67_14690 [Bradyrhizobium roseus]